MQNLWKHILDYCDMKRPEVIAYYKPLLDFQLGERLGLLIPMDPTRTHMIQATVMKSQSMKFSTKSNVTHYLMA